MKNFSINQARSTQPEIIKFSATRVRLSSTSASATRDALEAIVRDGERRHRSSQIFNLIFLLCSFSTRSSSGAIAERMNIKKIIKKKIFSSPFWRCRRRRCELSGSTRQSSCSLKFIKFFSLFFFFFHSSPPPGQTLSRVDSHTAALLLASFG